MAVGLRNHSYLIATGISIKRVLIGYIISLLIGSLLAFSVISCRFLDENLSPLFLGLQTLPSICWLPLAILWFGNGEGAILFVIAIGSVFSIAMGAISGVKNIPPIYMRLAKTMGAKGVQAYTTVIIPASLPALIGGMKQGWSFAWRGLIAGEMLSPKDGLGYILNAGKNLHNMNQIVGVIIAIICIGLVFEKFIFGRLEYFVRYRWGLTRA